MGMSFDSNVYSPCVTFNMVEFGTEEVSSESREGRHITAGHEAVNSLARCMAAIVGGFESTPHFKRGLISRRDQNHVASHHLSNSASQKRIVGATKQQTIDLGLKQRCQKALSKHPDLIRARLAAFNKLHETWAGCTSEVDAWRNLSCQPLVGTAGDCSHRADHSDPGSERYLEQGFQSWSENPNNGNINLSRQVVQGNRRGCVASHNDHLRVVLFDQKVSGLSRKSRHFVVTPRPVGIARGIAEIYNVLVGQKVDHSPCNGQPAEPRIKHGDRAIARVCGHLMSLRPWQPAEGIDLGPKRLVLALMLSVLL